LGGKKITQFFFTYKYIAFKSEWSSYFFSKQSYQFGSLVKIKFSKL
jgi:hypothetical protein